MSNSGELVPDATASSIQRADLPLDLREFTPARIALDCTGASIATRHALEFLLAHAQARDAVHSALAVPSLMAALRERELAAVSVRSAVADRTEYLRRPDLARTLSAASGAMLTQAKPAAQSGTALSLILADGLSALATERHALPVVDALLLLLGIGEPGCTWVLAPIVIAEQARVALGDLIGHALNADVTVMLIGERARPEFARLARRIHHLGAASRPNRCRAQLRLQHPHRGAGLRLRRREDPCSTP